MKRTRATIAATALATAALCLGILAAVPTSAEASFVGDLVFCDDNGNGKFNKRLGERGINGVEVFIRCHGADDSVCAEYTTTTGTIHESAQSSLNLFESLCGSIATWNPESTWSSHRRGRYLFEVFNDCANTPDPWICTVVVDQNSPALADCNALATPIGFNGQPKDGNHDGDYCDPEDGPFPEHQPLGNGGQGTECNDFPDPQPGDATYHVELFNPAYADDCGIYADFAFTPPSSGADCGDSDSGCSDGGDDSDD